MSVFVRGEGVAVALCAVLVTRSRAFVCTPFPDDEWQIAVKDEGGAAALLAPFAATKPHRRTH